MLCAVDTEDEEEVTERKQPEQVLARASSGRELFDPSDVARAFHVARVAVSFAIAAASAILAVVWSWPGGLFVGAVAGAVGGDALARFRKGTKVGLATLMVADVTAVGLAIILSGLPDMIVVAPYTYMLTAAVLVLSRSKGWRVSLYLAAWCIVILTLEAPLIEPALDMRQESLVLALGVIIYLGATYVLASTAAAAVRQRQALDERLRDSRRRLRAVVDGAPVVVFAIDADGTFSVSEGAGLASLGLEPGEVVGRRVADVYADAPQVVELVDRALAEGRELHDVVDLGVASFEVRMSPQHNPDGSVVGVIGIATDVSDAVEARRKLERKVVVEQLLAGISADLMALRPEGENAGIVEALGKVASYTGCDRVYLAAPPWGTLPPLAFSWSRTKRPGGDLGGTYLRLPWFEGRLHDWGHVAVERLSGLPLDARAERQACEEAGLQSLVAVPLPSDRLNGGYVVFATTGWERMWSGDDIMLFRLAAEMVSNVLARQRTRVRLEELVQSKDRFVASVSHELRTPLASVMGLSEELRDRLGDFSHDEIREFHDIIADEAGELSAIVEDLLVVARSDIDRVNLLPVATSLAAELGFVMAPLREHELQRMRVQVPDDIVAWCDRTRARQVLRNILMNALQYGGPAIEVRGYCDGGRAIVEVRDDGDGIADEDSQRIFEPYEAGGSDPGKPDSIGLGLAVAVKLATLMDGELAYDREDGWTVFRLTLPADQAPDHEAWRAAV